MTLHQDLLRINRELVFRYLSQLGDFREFLSCLNSYLGSANSEPG